MKKIITILILILALSAICVSIYMLKPQDKEKGDIKTNNANGSMKIDEQMYSELSSNVYKGTVNYQPLYFVFMKYLGEDESEEDQYECLVFYDTEDQQEAYASFTRYNAVINKDGMVLTYIDGPIESTFECEFKDGELYVNSTKLEKADLKDCPIQEI